MKSKLAVLAVGALMTASLVGCAPATPTGVAPVVTDAWIRAIPDTKTDGNMTGMFMTVTNNSDSEVALLGGTTDGTYTTDPLDAHEVVKDSSGQMVMQKVDGGIVIPAHQSVQLMPGGYHIMFWNLTKAIPVGATVHATLNFSNGTTAEVDAIAMTVEMGSEKYVGTPTPGTMNH
jgi:copper(I)-binding protein